MRYLFGVGFFMIKKIIAIWLVWLLSFLQIISYTYDSFFVSYDTTSAVNIYRVDIDSKNHQIIHTFSNQYNFFDGSKTIISLQWFYTTQAKIDFITNYEWLFLSNNNDNFLQKNNVDTTAKKISVLSILIGWGKDKKEKYIFSFKNFDIKRSDFSFEQILKESFVVKEIWHFYLSRGPPYIISITIV